MKKTLQFSALFLLVSVVSFAQSDKIWKRIDGSEIKAATNLRERSFPSSSNYFKLNVSSLRQQLFSAPKDAASSNVIVSIPNVNG